MPFCQNCGLEFEGNFCPKCGTPENNNPTHPNQIIHENAKVVSRYGTVSLLIAGYLGMSCLLGFYNFIRSNDGVVRIVAMLFLLLAVVFFLPGVFSIVRKTPKELIAKTICSFIVKSVLFCVAWVLVIVSCFWIFGFFVHSWRLGLLVSRCKDNEYTALVDGNKIGVIRVIDTDFISPNKTRYTYVDSNGEYYRPPLR